MEHKPQLPLYQCHKKVRAAKITHIMLVDYSNAVRLSMELPGGARDYIDVTPEFKVKHQPKVGGYFVQYLDPDTDEVLYESYSPDKAFEKGYSLSPNANGLMTSAGEEEIRNDSGVDIDAAHKKVERAPWPFPVGLGSRIGK